MRAKYVFYGYFRINISRTDQTINNPIKHESTNVVLITNTNQTLISENDRTIQQPMNALQ